MAREVPSPIYAAVFLTAADFDLDAKFGQVIDRALAFENSTGRLFGATDTDLRTSAFSLLFQSGRFSDLGLDKAEETLMDMRLGDLLTLALGYESVYCNDEGEYWEKSDGGENAFAKARESMRCFLSRSPAPSVEEVRSLLANTGLSTDALIGWAAIPS